MNIMKIKNTKPKYFWVLKYFFPEADWDKGVIVTYGKNVYCKHKLTDPLIAHEFTHVRQQTFPIYWWFKYALSPKFRFSQELPAHRAEYQAIKGYDNNKKEWLKLIAGRLSGPLYNNMVTLEEAKRLILHDKK